VVGGDILYSFTSALRCIELVVLYICPVPFLEAKGPRDYADSKFLSVGQENVKWIAYALLSLHVFSMPISSDLCWEL
jgi:hypothetical protein